MAEVNIRSSDPRNYQVPNRVSAWFRPNGLTGLADWIDLGHILEQSTQAEQETMEHQSQRRGELTVDREIIVGRKMNVNVRLDEVSKQNLMFAFGSSGPAVVGAVTALDNRVAKNPGNALTIDLGVTNLAAVVVRSEGQEGAGTIY